MPKSNTRPLMGRIRGEKAPGEKKKIGAAAERAWLNDKAAGTLKPAIARANCDVDVDLPPASRPAPPSPRLTDWILTGLFFGEAALITCTKVRSRFSNEDSRTGRSRHSAV